MIERLQSTVVFALYQLSIVVGITALPLAMLVRRAGLSVPLNRVIDRLDGAYENARSGAN